jgi:hypothetical protein
MNHPCALTGVPSACGLRDSPLGRPGGLMRTLHGLGLALALCLPVAAQAHKPSDAYLQLTVDGTRIEQRLDIALRDLDRELTLDANGDDAITWGEVRTRWAEIEAVATAGLRVQADGADCRAAAGDNPVPAQLDEHSDGRYAVLVRRWSCSAPVQALAVDYRLFADSDPTHRGILRIAGGGREQTAVLVPGGAPHRLALDEAGGLQAPSSWFGFVREGVHHILIGADHLLFLLALLLPAVLLRQRTEPQDPPAPPPPMPVVDSYVIASTFAFSHAYGAPAQVPAAPGLRQRAAEAWRARWRPAPALGPALWEVAKVVTAFTVAHSITLALAVLGVANPPSHWVESLIAASVALAALNNLVPVAGLGRAGFSFAFGLVHGFGFAGAMQGLPLAPGALAGALFGFNLGVELGQLAVLLGVVPLAWALRGRGFYVPCVLRGGSALIAVLALLWLVERAYGLALLPAFGG